VWAHQVLWLDTAPVIICACDHTQPEGLRLQRIQYNTPAAPNVTAQDAMQAQAALHAALANTLEADAGVRAAAEQQLTLASAQPGFAPALVAAARSPELPPALRQLALLVLKKFVRQRWEEGSPGFEAPECSTTDKEAVRGALPACLGDASSTVRTAAAMAVAAIFACDYPHAWPGVLEGMIVTIQDQQGVAAAAQPGGSFLGALLVACRMYRCRHATGLKPLCSWLVYACVVCSAGRAALPVVNCGGHW
jgi:hypothetical protein